MGWLSLSTRRGQDPTTATTPVIKTADTIIANNKQFTKYNKVANPNTKNGTRGDARNTHARPTITAGVKIHQSFMLIRHKRG